MERFRQRVVLVLLLGLACYPIASCGPGEEKRQEGTQRVSYTGKTAQCRISGEGFQAILGQVNGAAPVCTVSSSELPAPGAAGLGRLLRVVAVLARSPSQVGSDLILGDCGGKMEYRDLYYREGGLRGTLRIDRVCSEMGEEREYLDGEIEFVNYTPISIGKSGFRTSAVEASSPLIALTRIGAGGATVGASFLGLTGLRFVPSDSPSSDTTVGNYTVQSAALKYRNGDQEKTLLAEEIAVARLRRGDGAVEERIAGRLYLEDFGYLDAATDTADPIVVQKDGTHSSGTIRLYGSEGSQAKLSIVPASDPTFAVEVNGAPLAGTELSCGKVPLSQREVR